MHFYPACKILIKILLLSSFRFVRSIKQLRVSLSPPYVQQARVSARRRVQFLRSRERSGRYKIIFRSESSIRYFFRHPLPLLLDASPFLPYASSLIRVYGLSTAVYDLRYCDLFIPLFFFSSRARTRARIRHVRIIRCSK